ncbi:MAG: ATP-grasp domain-containing protein [Polyangiaceae bacterium]
MDIQKILVLRGPNVWANFPVIEVWVDLRPDLDVPSNTFPGFNERLKAWLPTMIEHRCGIRGTGGFFQRLDTGTYLGHILEHTSLEIQSLVGPVVGFGRARESFVPGVYRVAIEYAEERLGLACVRTAIALLTAARTGEPFDIDEELAKLRKLSEEACFGPSTQAIVSAARKRDIPWIRLAQNSLVQLGYGSEQRRIWTAETDQTSAIAESIAQDKDLTRRLLMQAGVPVPRGKAVASADEAVQAAEDLGYPVVVKPQEGNHGRGVSIDLRDCDGVAAAFDIAHAEGDGVVVEQCIVGDHHRLLVIGNRVVAAAQGEPDHVTGDGQRTIQQLVDWGNAQPNRGDPEIHPHDRLKLDAIALDLLKRQGLTPESVPAVGRRVVLHYNGDLTTDVTSRVHPEVARIAVLSARTVGLNIAGIDFVLSDVGRPVEEQQGAVLEVNASPSLLMHVKPLRGEPQPVGEAIVDDSLSFGKEREDSCRCSEWDEREVFGHRTARGNALTAPGVAACRYRVFGRVVGRQPSAPDDARHRLREREQSARQSRRGSRHRRDGAHHRARARHRLRPVSGCGRDEPR